MSKVFKLLTVLLLAGSLLSPGAFAKSDNAKESLVALGDSIPYGYNLRHHNHTSSKAAYPSVIGDEADLRVRNLAVPREQTEGLLGALQTDQKYRQAVKHADYITVSIINNDLLEILREAGEKSGGDPNLFPALLQEKLKTDSAFPNLIAILAEIRELSDAPIVLYNVYNPYQLTNQLHYVSDTVLPAINGRLAQIAYSFENVHIADANAAFGDNQAAYVIAGDIHPTAAGQAVLAQIGLDALNLD